VFSIPQEEDSAQKPLRKNTVGRAAAKTRKTEQGKKAAESRPYIGRRKGAM